MTDTKDATRESFLAIARAVADASVGRIRLAFNEEDASTALQPQSAHFLKVNGRRVGRDIELYAFMSEIQGMESTLPDILCEVLIPIKADHPGAYQAGAELLKKAGEATYSADMQARFVELF